VTLEDCKGAARKFFLHQINGVEMPDPNAKWPENIPIAITGAEIPTIGQPNGLRQFCLNHILGGFWFAVRVALEGLAEAEKQMANGKGSQQSVNEWKEILEGMKKLARIWFERYVDLTSSRARSKKVLKFLYESSPEVAVPAILVLCINMRLGPE